MMENFQVSLFDGANLHQNLCFAKFLLEKITFDHHFYTLGWCNM